MKIGRSRRPGVSPLIATIILIAITIVGGVLVYTILTGYIGRYSADDQVTVSSAELTVAPAAGADQGSGIFSITVKNSGTSEVTDINIRLLNGTSVFVLEYLSSPSDFEANSTQPLQPGLTASGTFYVYCPIQSTTSALCPEGANSLYQLTVDGTYTYQVSAMFSDGSTYDVSGTVAASS